MAPSELVVVGDADQSIYAFRGATIRNIVEFEQDYPEARTILLEQNYRSTQTILRGGELRHRPQREPPAQEPVVRQRATASGSSATSADNEHDEASFVAEEIDRLTDAGQARPGDVAVFYRTNAQSRALEEVFVRVGLPYKVVGGHPLLRAHARSRTPWPTCGCWPTPTDDGQPPPDPQRAQARHRRPRRGLPRRPRRA